jgi:uncharacterized membrane protein YphA (DoxX/SURF4 family)
MNLTNLHTVVLSKTLFIVFTWITRILLALAFIPSGLKKLLGLRFTTLGIETPVGFLFEALYRTGFYWNFLGFVQLVAALLILFPKTSFLGALIHLIITINILVIVCAMHFIGTPIIASLMLLANLYLFFWDLPKTKKLLSAIAR